MRAIRMHVQVPENRELSIKLPEDVEQGLAEVIVLVLDSETAPKRKSLQALLEEIPLPAEDRKSKEEIDALIREERASWEKV